MNNISRNTAQLFFPSFTAVPIQSAAGGSGANNGDAENLIATVYVDNDEAATDGGEETEVNDENKKARSKETAQKCITRLKSTSHRQKQRINRLLQHKKKTLEDEMATGLISKEAHIFFNLQKRTAGVAPRGRRYSDDEMPQALATSTSTSKVQELIASSTSSLFSPALGC